MEAGEEGGGGETSCHSRADPGLRQFHCRQIKPNHHWARGRRRVLFLANPTLNERRSMPKRKSDRFYDVHFQNKFLE